MVEQNSTTCRKIIHVDMDYFYAQVEELERPELRDIPVAIGGPSKTQGVLCTTNYRAREFGVRAGQSTYEAFKKCPDMLLVYPNFEKYKEMSKVFRSIYEQYTKKIQLVGLDEAYLDVSNSTALGGSAILIAREIREKIFQQTRITCSAGISINKMLAKIASDWNKPNGMYAVLPEDRLDFMAKLPLRKIPGVGKVTIVKLNDAGLTTAADVMNISISELTTLLGKRKSARLYQNCHGICNDEVISERKRKSISFEKTYFDGLPIQRLQQEVNTVLDAFCHKLMEVEEFHFQGRTVTGFTLKVRNSDFQTFTKAIQLDANEGRQIIEGKTLKERHKATIGSTFLEFTHINSFRLIGIGVKLDNTQSQQLELLL
ncbi:DNA polymerase IV [Vibrio parahaemolyticus]|nr:DNA polymerase IV [Vibrio parahaemolyticus]EHK2867843.1 DNA polymerase IV [Vibrio parahaemolyticus]EJG0670598.1 DNA polymerase IV [Vibrio parahaemolyticus]EKB1982616.1 DNA polymerase IV [Vibrio parahaemolyticus]ELA9531506.1 DNA polymerase IV [Vibrio parahaemolyticus]